MSEFLTCRFTLWDFDPGVRRDARERGSQVQHSVLHRAKNPGSEGGFGTLCLVVHYHERMGQKSINYTVFMIFYVI